MAANSRTVNASRNLIWGGINKIILLICPFILRTIFIYTIGLEYLGINSLFTSVLQILSLAELGFGSAVVYSLYEPLANKDTRLVCHLMGFLRKVYRIIGISIFIIGLGLTFCLDKIIKGSVLSNINLYYVYYIFLINTVISYLFAGYKACLLTANQRDDIKSKVFIISTLVQYILQGSILIILKNYYLYLIILPITTLVVNILNSLFVKKYFPDYVARKGLPKELIKPLYQQIAGLFISRISGVSRNAVVNILISAYVGLIPLAMYTNYLYVQSSVHSVLTIVGVSILAGIGNSIVLESETKNYKDFINFNFLYMWIVGWIFCCLIVLFQPFIKLWLGRDALLAFPTVVLICLTFYFTGAGDIRNTYVNATGIWWKNKWRSIFEGILNVVLGIFLIKIYKIMGVILAVLITTILFNFWIGTSVLYRAYFKSFKIKDFILRQSIYFLITIIGTSITYLCCYYIQNEDIVAFIFRLVICLIVPNLIYLLFYSKLPEFKAMIVILKRITKKH